MKYTTREYQGKNVNLGLLTNLITGFFTEERFRTQSSKDQKGILIQVRKGGVFRPILSTDKCFNLVVEGNKYDFKIKMGVGQWIQGLNSDTAKEIFSKSNGIFQEISEALWTYELEHNLWHYIENQIDLGIV